MRIWLPIVLVLALASVAVGQDTGNVLPPKPPTVGPPNIPDPNRQGGDTIADATVIPSLPYSDTGTTAGYTNDYDEACPYTDSTAPDVVYSYTPVMDEVVIIDLCGSDYDTKLYVYDSDLNLVACNDDAYSGEPCGVYVSALEDVTLQGGTTYFIVIDGYGNAFGPYLLDVHIFVYVPCILECPTGGFAEGEPPLVDNYVDNWNGGCNTPPYYPFQELMGDAAGNLVLCGVSGWYLCGGPARDTDWFNAYMGPSGTIEITVDAEQPTYVFVILPDCSLGVIQSILVEACVETGMMCTSYPWGDFANLVIAPTVFTTPPGADNEYDYVVWFSGLEPAVATESTTWGTVKALYQ